MNKKRHLGILFLFSLLTILMTYPLVCHLGSAIPGLPGDNFEYLWKVWWFKHSLLDQGKSPFFAQQIFYPDGFYLANAEMTPANTVLAIPFTTLFGYTVSYNLIILSSFILSGFGMYLLVHYLTGNPVAALLSGVIFAFSPYHTIRAFKHLPLVSIQWIPFLFLYLEKLIREKRLIYAILAGIFYSLAALSSWYYAFSVGLFLLGYLLYRARPWREHLFNMQFFKSILVFLAVGAILIIPFLIPYLQFRSQGVMKYTLGEVDQYSASLEDFFLPSPLHPLWGKYIEKHLSILKEDWAEQLIFLGFTPLVLAILALRKRKDKIVRTFGLVAIFSALLASGTSLHILGKRLYLPWLNIPIPLPAIAFFSLPFVNSMRVWARFGLITIFAVAVLAGLGASYLLTKNRSRLAGIFLLILILFEFVAIPFPMSQVKPRPVDFWLARQKKMFNLIQLPLSLDGPQMYYSIIHGKRIATGTGTFLMPAYNDDRYRLSKFPDQESIKVLKRRRVDLVLIEKKKYGQAWPEVLTYLKGREDFQYLRSIQGIEILRIKRRNFE